MKEEVIKIFSEIMKVPVESINEESSPDNIEEWDSLKHMNLVLALEEKFGVQFTDIQIVEMLNVSLILMNLQEALGEA